MGRFDKFGLPFRTNSQLKQKLEETQRNQFQQNQDNARENQRLKEELRQRERQEFLRKERDRQEEEKRQRENEQEQLRMRQVKIMERERENQKQERLRKTTPEALRRLRDLIRTRYQMDIYIWSLRGVQKADYEDVIEEGKKADAVLQEIYSIINTWEENGWTQEEWRVARKIIESFQESNPRIWQDNPPWNEPEY